jgi:hypothetical protein
VAVDGLKRKITEILSAGDDDHNRLMYDPEEPTSNKLTSYSTSKSDIGKTGSTGFIGQLDVVEGDT